MRAFQPVYLLSVTLFLILSLSGCSSSEQESDESSSDTAYNQDDNSSQEEPSQEQLYLADGWRKGKLHIEIAIQQDGGTTDPGDTSLESRWTSTITGTSDLDVVVAKDLRPYVSQGPLANTLVQEYEPFRLIDQDALSVQASEVLYTATESITSNEVKSSHQGEYKGHLDRIYLQSLNPSLFGPGYEAYLKLNTRGQLKTREVISGEGQTPITNESNEEKTEEIVYSLHPVPNADKLNDYDYLPAGVNDEMKQAIVKQNMDMLSLLNDAYKDNLPAQGQIRAGMVSEATQDSLTMTYEYTGNKELGRAIMMGFMTGNTNHNSIKIRIQLTANP